VIPRKILGFLGRSRGPAPDGRSARRRASTLQLERVEVRILLSVIGKDTRKPVLDTTVYPFSAVVHLSSIFSTPTKAFGYFATGALIDPLHVLTAAHVVYARRLGGDATSITATPGENGRFAPVGKATAIVTHVDPVYMGDPNQLGSDLALITLDHPIDRRTGAFGLRAEPDSFFVSRVLDTAGYPGDKGNGAGNRMYRASGFTASTDDPNLLAHTIDTHEGQSGSPLWETIGGQAYIVGVHNLGTKKQFHLPNFAVRITRDKIDEIRGWIAQDRAAGIAALGPVGGGSSPGLTTTLYATAGPPFASPTPTTPWV
jgi:glutamyl endopeptidase